MIGQKISILRLGIKSKCIRLYHFDYILYRDRKTHAKPFSAERPSKMIFPYPEII